MSYNESREPGAPGAVSHETTTSSDFKPDMATRMADAEQRSFGTMNQNPHAPNSEPSAIDKMMGGVERGIGKVMGDKELEKKGTIAQGKAYETAGHEREYETEAGVRLGGNSAYEGSAR
ncbi:hypothetical protein JCM10207_001711 [Rhodosporidiobolus poonsookiae]